MQVHMNTINLLFNTKTCLPYICENVGVRQGEVVFDNVTGIKFPYKFVKIYTSGQLFMHLHLVVKALNIRKYLNENYVL